MKMMNEILTAHDSDTPSVRAGIVVVVVMLAVEGLAVGETSS